MTRELVYPDYHAEAFEGGDIRLRFVTPGSKFGPVHVFLAADDAAALLLLLDKAIDDSAEILAAEASQ